MENAKSFLDVYCPSPTQQLTVVDIGAQDVNGSLRSLVRDSMRYTGVDFVPGNGVDVVLDDPYSLPFPDASVDVLLSSSCFEHSEMFWVLFLEILRVLKPSGLFYLNVPSNGEFHRYPVDCWRFYPDSGGALVTWARRNGLAPALLESFVSVQIDDQWSDYVAVFVKEETQAGLYPHRILDAKLDVYNGQVAGNEKFVNFSIFTEDQRKLAMIDRIATNRAKVGLELD